MNPVVAVRPCPTYDTDVVLHAVRAAVGAVCNLSARVRGKTVLIKINLLSDAPPAKAVCTHPEVTRALIRVCREAGAAEIRVGDMPGMHLTDVPEVAFDISGTTAVCQEEGVEIAAFRRRGYREVELPRFHKLRNLMFAKDVLETDFVISAPKLKSHMQALYTGAIKNWFGVVANRDRKRSHHLAGLEPFSESLVDIFRVRPPDLTVMDGIVGMEGRGPGEGKPKTLGLVLASTDAVALDTVALECVDYRRMNVPHVLLAGREGLGEADLARIRVDGPPLETVRVPFELPPRAFANPPKFVFKWFYRLWRVQPLVLCESCQVCGACERMCPVGAITTRPESAVINYDICIECFCCHEVCPHNAIGEKMTLAYRLYRAVAQWRRGRNLRA
jgi:uncharacterized protein (DUF362 family)/Pyruvate/2-oxoacid:ferredoxin oxidoreductase delta subunit